MKTFATWLKGTRERLKWSQERLAKAVHELDPESGVHQCSFTQWEKGRAIPSYRQFTLISIALGLSEAEIRSGDKRWKAAQLAGIPLDLLSDHGDHPLLDPLLPDAMTGDEALTS